MANTATRESAPTKPKIVEVMRNPLARSEYSDVLASIVSDYLSEIFSQPNKPATILEIEKRNGLWLFEGSILRGSATAETADVDLALFLDSSDSNEQKDEALSFSLAVAERDIEQYHPRRIKFSNYVLERLKNDPTLEKHFSARMTLLEKIRVSLNPNRESVYERIAQYPNEFIHIDSVSSELNALTEAIEMADPKRLERRDIPIRLILSILTATSSCVYETQEGSLIYFQRCIVESLLKLRASDPQSFDEFYKQLGYDFTNLHRSTARRYPQRDIRLLAEYYLRTGRVVLKYAPQEKLLEIVTFRLLQDELQKEIRYLRHSYEVYANADKLTERMVGRHWKETGLTKADFSRLTQGEVIEHPLEITLSPEAMEEVNNVTKRVKILAGVRNQLHLPSIDEFASAYLR